MNGKTKLKIPRRSIVPTNERAQWLDKYGVPDDSYEIEVEAPLLAWQAAGAEIATDGSLSFCYGDSEDTRDELIRKACENARTKGPPPALSSEEIMTILIARGLCIQEKKDALEARKAELNVEAESYLNQWLSLSDDEVVTVQGVKTYWLEREQRWSTSGRSVMHSNDPRYIKAYNRRVALHSKLCAEQRKLELEERERKISELQKWASERDPRIEAGLKLGYEMSTAIGQLLHEAFNAQMKDKYQHVVQVVEGTDQWETLEVERQESPTIHALWLLGEFQKAVISLQMKDAPQAAEAFQSPLPVDFDEPEIMVCKDSGDDEQFVAIVVTCFAPGLSGRYFMLTVE